MGSKRGQVSIEYLIVVGLVGFLVISVLGVAFFYTNSAKDQIKMNQLQNFANKLIGSSESVYYSGEPSRATIISYLPQGVNSIEIVDSGKSLYFEISTASGVNKLSFSSDVTLYLDPAYEISTFEGSKRIKLVANETGVKIQQV